jgi:2-methylcitrate dehydratase PrpD
MGFDKMRSRIAIRMKDGRKVESWADERYRGGPENPLSDADVEAKVRSCCEGILAEAGQSKLIDTAWRISDITDAGDLMRIMNHLQ